MDARMLLELVATHRGKVIGVVLGLAFGWFAITYGILKAVFVSLCVCGGYFIGKYIDERVDVGEIFGSFFQKK